VNIAILLMDEPPPSLPWLAAWSSPWPWPWVACSTAWSWGPCT